MLEIWVVLVRKSAVSGDHTLRSGHMVDFDFVRKAQNMLKVIVHFFTNDISHIFGGEPGIIVASHSAVTDENDSEDVRYFGRDFAIGAVALMIPVHIVLWLVREFGAFFISFAGVAEEALVKQGADAG